MSTALQLDPTPPRRASQLWRPVILATGFQDEALEMLVFWFSDIADHPSEPILIVSGAHGGLPQSVDQLGLVAQIRTCPNSHFVKWADHADIFTVGAGGYDPSYRPPCPMIAVAARDGRAQLGIDGFCAQTGEEWRDVVRAMLDDPALCLALSPRREIPENKPI